MSRWALRIAIGVPLGVMALLALTFWILVAGILPQGD